MLFPQTFPIIHDDYHAAHIGKLPDGTQFFVTMPFRPAMGEDSGSEYLAVFLFEADGKFRVARIDDFEPRNSMDKDLASSTLNKRMKELGEITYCDIKISPFSMNHQGTEFGFITEEETESIEIHPGNYMAFFEPWDGFYDT